jgi:hypothetical protein
MGGFYHTGYPNQPTEPVHKNPYLTEDRERVPVHKIEKECLSIR